MKAPHIALTLFSAAILGFPFRIGAQATDRPTFDVSVVSKYLASDEAIQDWTVTSYLSPGTCHGHLEKIDGRDRCVGTLTNKGSNKREGYDKHAWLVTGEKTKSGDFYIKELIRTLPEGKVICRGGPAGEDRNDCESFARNDSSAMVTAVLPDGTTIKGAMKNWKFIGSVAIANGEWVMHCEKSTPRGRCNGQAMVENTKIGSSQFISFSSVENQRSIDPVIAASAQNAAVDAAPALKRVPATSSPRIAGPSREETIAYINQMLVDAKGLPFAGNDSSESSCGGGFKGMQNAGFRIVEIIRGDYLMGARLDREEDGTYGMYLEVGANGTVRDLEGINHSVSCKIFYSYKRFRFSQATSVGALTKVGVADGIRSIHVNFKGNIVPFTKAGIATVDRETRPVFANKLNTVDFVEIPYVASDEKNRDRLVNALNHLVELDSSEASNDPFLK